MYINEKIKEDFISLGNHIKNLRNIRKLTVKELSLKTGISARYLQKIEKGIAYGVLFDKHLCKIANSLQVKISELLNFK